jgi:hypothetical protein
MPFEDDLGPALRRTGDAFHTDQQRLARAGLARGRRALYRRRATVTGGVAAIALVGMGGAWAGGLLSTGSGSGDGKGSGQVASGKTSVPSGNTTPKSGSKHSFDEGWMTGTLKRLLPDGNKAADFGGHGTAPFGGRYEDPYAVATLDDGKGRATLGIYFRRVDPRSEEARKAVTCPDEAQATFDACKVENLPDGSTRMTLEGNHPKRWVTPKEFKEWHAVLVTPQGLVVDATARNTYLEKTGKPARSTPSLPADRLQALATDPVWRQLTNEIVGPLAEGGGGSGAAKP